MNNVDVDYDNIFNKLITIIEERLKLNIVHIKSKNNNYKRDNIFDVLTGIRARDLVILLFEIEKEFNIDIPEKYIINDKFNSLENITQIIYEIKSTYEN